MYYLVRLIRNYGKRNVINFMVWLWPAHERYERLSKLDMNPMQKMREKLRGSERTAHISFEQTKLNRSHILLKASHADIIYVFDIWISVNLQISSANRNLQNMVKQFHQIFIAMKFPVHVLSILHA